MRPVLQAPPRCAPPMCLVQHACQCLPVPASAGTPTHAARTQRTHTRTQSPIAPEFARPWWRWPAPPPPPRAPACRRSRWMMTATRRHRSSGAGRARPEEVVGKRPASESTSGSRREVGSWQCQGHCLPPLLRAHLRERGMGRLAQGPRRGGGARHPLLLLRRGPEGLPARQHGCFGRLSSWVCWC